MNEMTEVRRSVLFDMAVRYGMEPAAFEQTVRATCMKPDRNGKVPTREEFAAFLLVAKQYSLNPLTKEIYAFTAKGGGIVPVVSVDGWINLVNSHPACDGFEFNFDHADNGVLVSCTCTMYRKDRNHPVAVTEYLAECIRGTEPWAMKHRMLRHKALIQAARYSFGFAGIYDEDEARKIVDVVSQREERSPAPPQQRNVMAALEAFANDEVAEDGADAAFSVQTFSGSADDYVDYINGRIGRADTPLKIAELRKLWLEGAQLRHDLGLSDEEIRVMAQHIRYLTVPEETEETSEH